MRIEAVELRRIELPLLSPFETSFGVQSIKDALLIRVVGEDSEGWGECVAMSEPTYSSEYVQGAHDVIRRHLLPRIFARGHISAAHVGPGLADVKGHPMAKAALEMAVLDAELRAGGRSLATELGAVRDRVPAGVSVGIMATIEALLETVGAYIDEGYLRVKLKIKPGWDVGPVRSIREHFGDDLALQVDANSAYTPADVEILKALDPFGLLLIEQPFADDDMAGHAALARHISTPVCLDESITSVATAGDAIDRGACTIVNIKAGRVGGYLEARRIHDLCRSRGVAVWCGGMLETGLGRAANVALAALPGFTLPGDISASSRYWARDITEPFVLHEGHLTVPDGPGIGVVPDVDQLKRVTTSVSVLRPGA